MTDLADDLAAYRDRVERAGLAAYADALVALARPAIRLVPELAADPDHTRTRLGGAAELPPATPWPTYAGRPLALVAQVDLAEVAALGVPTGLPAEGLLAFFYDSVEQPPGSDPADRGSAAVLHTPAATPTRQRAEGPAHPAVGLRAEPELSVAPFESSDLEGLGMSASEERAYLGLLEHDGGVVHRLAGHAQPVQGDMQRECRAVTGRGEATEWRLLLQVDTQDEARMTWGDVGRLYWWIRADDLAARAWDRIWLVRQSY
jgi:uncharacterized protein YwqG